MRNLNLIKFAACFMLAGITFTGTSMINNNQIVTQVEAAESVTVKQGQSIQSAIDSLKNGGIVIVEAGTYNEFLTFNNSGITLKANGKVVLDGQNKDGHLIDLNGQSNITIDGFILTNLKGNEVAGVYLGGGEQHIQILNNEMYNFNKTKSGSNGSCVNGIILFGESKTPISDVLIQGNHLHDMDLNWSEALSVTGNAEYVEVINNKVHDMTNIGIDFCGNFGYAPSKDLDQPRHCVARGNIIYNCNSPYATSYGLYCDGAYDITFEDNVIYNCQGGIEVGAEEYVSGTRVGDVIVHNNLVYGCSENGLHVGGYDSGNKAEVVNVKVYNNTLVNNTEELFLSKCDGVELYNNIFYNNKNNEILYNEFDSSKTKNVNFHDNIYYTKGTSEFYFTKKSYDKSSWLNSVEKSALFQDPKLDSNYLPTANTPSGKGYQAIETPVIPEQPQEPETPIIPEQPVEPETPVIPEQPQEPSEAVEGNILPTLDQWEKQSRLKVASVNGYDIVFTAPKAWTGIYLWGSKLLNVGDTVTVGVESISNNAQFVIEDSKGNVLAEINKDRLSQTFVVPSSPLEIYITTSNTKEASIKGIYAVVNTEQPQEPETPVIPEQPVDPQPEQPQEPETPVIPEQPVEDDSSIITTNAIYYTSNPNKISAEVWAQYDYIIFNSKYYEKSKDLIKQIKALNENAIIIFAEKQE